MENADGYVLLVKTVHGGWVFPGGQVESGENLMDALTREIQEESGIHAAVSHLIGVYSNTGIHKWHDGVTDVPTKLLLEFACSPLGGELQTSEETTACRWVAKDEALALITAPAVRTRYQAYLDFDGQVPYMAYVTRPEFEVKLERKV